ncbi:MAG: DEAD/DEAH box helicase [Candidatus Omnitrophica bacterium]|nr:DEAD/DEAH box helicase [Candidatus Omnitrophota bacterium]
MPHTLRPYQEEAIQALYDFWSEGQGINPLICMPTGSGKSLVIAEFIKQTCTRWPGVRVCILTHKRELIVQNEAELLQQWPDAHTGVYSAGLNRKEIRPPILFAGIQSIYKHAFDLEKIDVAIVDEAHLIPRSTETRYGKFLADLRVANPNLVVVGLTATPYRLDSGLLYEGDDALFDGIAYDTDLLKLIEEGFLLPVVSRGGRHKIDLSGVHTRMGEYASNELETAANDYWVVRDAVYEIIEQGEDRNSWLIFASGVKHARHILEVFESHNIDCALVTGETPTAERDQIIDAFKNQRLKCLVNVEVFSTGFNAPCCDLIALLTATKSTGKYVQIVGRGMRPCPGKENCLLLDFGGNVMMHGPIDSVSPKPASKKDGTGEAPSKECGWCNEIVAAGVRVCPRCGTEFPKPALNHSDKSFDGAVLSSQEHDMWVNVLDPVEYLRWGGKNDKPDTLRCNYYTDGREKPYCMWIAPDHGGYAARKAHEYIRACGGQAKSVDHCLSEMFFWQDPTRIKVGRDPKNKRYWRVLAFDFPD